MKHKLNSFSGAFEGTTKGLEGIANALKREKPVQNYPRFLKFDFDGDHPVVLRIDQDLTATKVSGFGDYGSNRIENECYIFYDSNGDGIYNPDGPGDDVYCVKFDLSTFAITEKLDGYSDNASWIEDPPQS